MKIDESRGKSGEKLFLSEPEHNIFAIFIAKSQQKQEIRARAGSQKCNAGHFKREALVGPTENLRDKNNSEGFISDMLNWMAGNIVFADKCEMCHMV